MARDLVGSGNCFRDSPKHWPPKLLTARARTARVEKVALECQALGSEQRLEGRSCRMLAVGGAIAYALRAELLGSVPKRMPRLGAL